MYINSVHLKLISFLYKDEETIPNCNIEVNAPTDISVKSADLPHTIRFNLFDHVRVSLKLRKSHAHRHLVYMTLVDLDHTELPPKKLMTNSEMMASIKTVEEDEEVKTMVKRNKKKKKSNNMYDVLEKYRKLSLIESGSPAQ
jgi:DIS3-like exonuclease 1